MQFHVDNLPYMRRARDSRRPAIPHKTRFWISAPNLGALEDFVKVLLLWYVSNVVLSRILRPLEPQFPFHIPCYFAFASPCWYDLYTWTPRVTFCLLWKHLRRR